MKFPFPKNTNLDLLPLWIIATDKYDADLAVATKYFYKLVKDQGLSLKTKQTQPIQIYLKFQKSILALFFRIVKPLPDSINTWFYQQTIEENENGGFTIKVQAKAELGKLYLQTRLYRFPLRYRVYRIWDSKHRWYLKLNSNFTFWFYNPVRGSKWWYFGYELQCPITPTRSTLPEILKFWKSITPNSRHIRKWI